MDIELAQALAENELLKSLLYCTKRSCNNCGKVTCENFQRQRKDCCENWVSYKDYIKQLEAEKDKAWWEGFDTCKAKAGEANVKLSDEITLLKAQIEKMKSALIDIKSNTDDVNIEWQIKYLFDELEIKEND